MTVAMILGPCTLEKDKLLISCKIRKTYERWGRVEAYVVLASVNPKLLIIRMSSHLTS